MTPQSEFLIKYGNPMINQLSFERKWMMSCIYPSDIAIVLPVFGHSVYCNKDFAVIYLKFLRLLIQRGLHKEIKENDQCFMVRYVRGSTTIISNHSWGMAVDLNFANNLPGYTREQSIAKGLTPFSLGFYQAARDAGLVVGYDFKTKVDGNHFEHTKGLYAMAAEDGI